MARSATTAVVALTVALSAFADLTGAAAFAPVPVTVHFKLTDLQYRPLPAVPVRLVLGAPKDWQLTTIGETFITDDAGEHHFKTAASVDRRSKKVSVDFVATRSMTADFLSVAAELPYLQSKWLYTIDVYRFPDETNALLDPMEIYTPDARDRFTKKAERIGGSWKMAELGGQMLTNAGYDVWEFGLHPGPAANEWTLQISFKKWPEPVRR